MPKYTSPDGGQREVDYKLNVLTGQIEPLDAPVAADVADIEAEADLEETLPPDESDDQA